MTMVLVALPIRLFAQQADHITISRTAHDAAWVASGAAVTLTLKELGVSSKTAWLIGSVGLVAATKLYECTKFCGQGKGWPARVALRDATYDITLSSAVLPLLIGKRNGWKAGVLAGVVWVGSVVALREAKWNSP